MSSEAWYAVNTKANSELLAASQLRKQGFHVYLPWFEKTRKHARKVENILAPLFPRYLFIRLDISASRWQSVNGTVGVSRLVSFGDIPARVPDLVIDEIKGREGKDGSIRMEPKGYHKGEAVRVIDNALGECNAIFEDMSGKDRVVVLLNLLGRQVRTTVKAVEIKAA